MKKLFGRIFCIMLCALTLVCSTAMAEPLFTLDSDGYIAAVTMDPEAQTLIIPTKVGGTDVRGIRAGVFSSYSSLKVVLLEVSRINSFANDALDFTSAPNLECIYLTADVNYNRLPDLLMRNSDVDLLQYIDLSTDQIYVDSIAYEYGMVKLVFWDILPSGYYGYNYHITRTEQGSGVSDNFNSAEDLTRFDIEYGTVRFSDNTVQQGQEYSYSIVAEDPFGRISIPCETSISIPAAKPVDPPQPPETDDDTSIIIPTTKPVEPLLPPATGDGANLILWSALVGISLVGMMLLCRRKEV